ncbi:MAG: mechanosensitive ion channel domain-containing protein [Bacteroidales bacterium]
MNRKAWLLLFVWLFSVVGYSQSDTITGPDSLSQSILMKETVSLMNEVAKRRVQDSLREDILLKQLQAADGLNRSERARLERELSSLRAADSVKRAELVKSIAERKKGVEGVPVVLVNDTICKIYTNIAQFSAEERAAGSSAKILHLAKRYNFKRDSLMLVPSEGGTMIMHGSTILLNVTESDAIWMEKDRMELANIYKDRLLDAIAQYQSETTIMNRVKQVGLALLVIIIQIFLIWGVNRLFKTYVDKRIIEKEGVLFKGFKIKDYQLLDSHKEIEVVLFFSKVLRYGINLLQLYITLPILFSIFPATEHWAEMLFLWILTPVSKIFNGFIDYIPNILTILVIYLVTRYVVKFFGYIMGEIESGKLEVGGFYSDWSRATFNIIRFLLYAFMMVMIFPYLPGSDSEIFKGASVFIGIVFSLGSSSVVSNIVAGMVITYMRPFKLGDRIKVGDLIGDVVEKTPVVTRLRTPKNEVVTVPNSTLISSNVVNYSSETLHDGLILSTTVTIGYDAPWRQVHELLISAAERTPLIIKEPKPYVLQTSLDDFYVSYQLCAYTSDAQKMARTYSALHANIQDSFNEAGVEIMSPHYRAERDGNAITIPPQ